MSIKTKGNFFPVYGATVSNHVVLIATPLFLLVLVM
tara:strand:+ start:1229 stop:1336 length:108 start_codon:yes stop_codon:yes gene_type:complete